MDVMWQIVMQDKDDVHYSDDVFEDAGVAMAFVDSWLTGFADQTWAFEKGEWVRYGKAGVRVVVSPRGVIRV